MILINRSIKPNTLLFIIYYLLVSFSHLLAQEGLTFSQERGFYKNSFELIITTENKKSTIKYTLDGSDPRSSDNAFSSGSPKSINISPYLNTGRAITPGVIVRACAISDKDTSDTETHSYIFLSEVKFQIDISPEMEPYWPNQRRLSCTQPEGLPSWVRSNIQLIDLGVDPEVVSKEEYFSAFEEALSSIPSLSLVTDPENLFGDDFGIYRYSSWSGIEWERPGSIELIEPKDEGFQSNSGIRIRGGMSSSGLCPKHSFRLFFRKEYGNGKLNYPLFGETGTDEFDKIDLRSSQHNSWHAMFNPKENANYAQDWFARKNQGAMQQPYTRSKYYHLYLNGMYWGLYQTQERAEANFAESYLGGAKEDYDVIKASGPSTDQPNYTLEATDGNLDAARALWEIATQGFNTSNYNLVRGLDADGTPNPEYPIYLDEKNLMDYCILNLYAGNQDGPTIGGWMINNYFGIYNQVNPDGFKFFVHDSELAFLDLNDDVINQENYEEEPFETFNPGWLHWRLMQHTDYRQKFADRLYKHFFNNGVLTPENAARQFTSIVNEFSEAIIGESARWGDVQVNRPLTKKDNWDPAIENFLESYIPQRTDIVVAQLKENGLLSNLHPPKIDATDFTETNVGLLFSGTSFKLINPNESGDIYYTLNNIDPRANGGAVSDEAKLYSEEIDITGTVFLKTRVMDNEEWSPLNNSVVLKDTTKGLCISEINYNPAPQIIKDDTLKSKSLEFVEIKNYSNNSIDLSGYQLTDGIQYQFTYGTVLQADSLLVIASDTASFYELYGFKAFGQFTGNLNNNGEEISCLNPCGIKINEVNYKDKSTWHPTSDGTGFSLVFIDYQRHQKGSSKEDWRTSTNWLGSPGKDDPEPLTDSVYITEVVANSEFPLKDAIELYNPTDKDINLGAWYLSDEAKQAKKWKIASGTTISANDYFVLYEGHYVADTLRYAENEFGSAFSISSGGERIYLYQGTETGNIFSPVCSFQVEATSTNISFGEYQSASDTKHFIQLDPESLGTTNTTAWKSPIIFKALMYHPAEGNYEYLILKNRTDSIVNLFHPKDSSLTWKVKGIGFSFPPGFSIGAQDSVYLVEKAIHISNFKTVMKIPETIKAFNYPGKLKNSSELISLQSPLTFQSDSLTETAWINMEELRYSDDAPWPKNADGEGYTLQRKYEDEFANDVSNWKSIYNTIPYANAGANQRLAVGKTILLDGSKSSDPGKASLSYNWKLVSEPEGSNLTIENSNTVSPGISPEVEGNYLFSLQVNNGIYQSHISMVSVFAYENQAPIPFVSKSNFSINVGELASIDASESYDPDYDEIFYEWNISEQPEESTQTILDNDLPELNFSPEMGGKFKIEMTVNDGDLFSIPKLVNVNSKLTSPIEENILPEQVTIYPNPSHGEVFIRFKELSTSFVEIAILEPNGKLIAIIPQSELVTDKHTVSYNLNNFAIPKGLYLIRIKADDFIETRKLVFY